MRIVNSDYRYRFVNEIAAVSARQNQVFCGKGNFANRLGENNFNAVNAGLRMFFGRSVNRRYDRRIGSHDPGNRSYTVESDIIVAVRYSQRIDRKNINAVLGRQFRQIPNFINVVRDVVQRDDFRNIDSFSIADQGDIRVGKRRINDRFTERDADAVYRNRPKFQIRIWIFQSDD